MLATKKEFLPKGPPAVKGRRKRGEGKGEGEGGQSEFLVHKKMVETPEIKGVRGRCLNFLPGREKSSGINQEPQMEGRRGEEKEKGRQTHTPLLPSFHLKNKEVQSDHAVFLLCFSLTSECAPNKMAMAVSWAWWTFPSWTDGSSRESWQKKILLRQKLVLFLQLKMLCFFLGGGGS